MKAEFESIIHDRQTKSFVQAAQKNYWYNKRKFFTHTDTTGVETQVYESQLPPFKGQSVSAIIAKKLSQNADVTIVDAGCGPKALALRDIEKKYPTGLKTIGVNATRERMFGPFRGTFFERDVQ